MPNDSNDASGERDTTELISLAQAAKISGLSHGHLRLLAKQGKFWAIKIGRDWLTTEESLQAYLATDRRTGPKPKK